MMHAIAVFTLNHFLDSNLVTECRKKYTHKHTGDEPGLTGWPLDFPSPFVSDLCILSGHKTFCIFITPSHYVLLILEKGRAKRGEEWRENTY